MNFAYFNTISCAVIVAWAIWVVIVPGIMRDGPVGKILATCLAINAFVALLYGLEGRINSVAEIDLNVWVAALVFRHWLLHTWWERIRARWYSLRRR
ncbi:hypothetical protein D3C84_1118410 [compost metagenome]